MKCHICGGEIKAAKLDITIAANLKELGFG